MRNNKVYTIKNIYKLSDLYYIISLKKYQNLEIQENQFNDHKFGKNNISINLIYFIYFRIIK